MAVQKQVLDKSRLGRLLVNRGYITEIQLEEALVQQRQENTRLGEVLIERGWITDKELSRTLKHQSRYRYAAAFIAMAVTPLQPMMAMAASTTAQAVPVPQTHSTQQLKSKGLRPLDDTELGAVSAQGLLEDFTQLYAQVEQARIDPEYAESLEEEGGIDSIKVLSTLGEVFFPIAGMLDAEVEIEGVRIDPDRVKPLFTGDGGFNVTLPNRIERVSFKNIRPVGQIGGPTMGTVHLEGIEFSDDASIVIRPFY